MKLPGRLTVTALLSAGLATSAGAGTLTFQGVTFTSSVSGNILTIEIDAVHPTGDWVTATTIGALQIKDIGNFDAVSLTAAPGAAIGWTLSPHELNANGCEGGAHSKQSVCYYGTHVVLTDKMIFQYAFTGANTNFTSPDLKVNFFVGDNTSKIGSLLSMTLPAVPEPHTYAMLFGGLAVLGALARRRRNNF
ncbi:hypothetical protein GCM10027321_13950 [Massilia terrae]|uniref:PEP-CTERM sorting domain-containing protein n=1 Tax=Massilia terrae TaxID=1811224 RepID=A0ABT2CUX9_9BURK|nr:PEP-CTERM sorting domain-containing protein [Massilia terrae]